MGPLDKDVVRDDALTATDEGYALEIHSHWYRSLPLTSLAVVDLTLDGEPSTVGADRRGERQDVRLRRARDLVRRVVVHHGCGDPADSEPNAAPGGKHRVELDLGLSIPYLIVGPGEGQPLLASSHTDKTIACT